MKKKVFLLGFVLVFCSIITVNAIIVDSNGNVISSGSNGNNGGSGGNSESDDGDYSYARTMADWCHVPFVGLKECVSVTCEVSYANSTCDEESAKYFDTCSKTCQ
ncbi:hypothetical protein [Dysgonomonas macrotermitis]|uniref:Uncharacterized protein n=1 Tax=Dysgonomonas macrotermitis TaxID=1346286 RepID=A0A1M4WL92_9BACT|nr:hypothetical protein [Dysgonomonas macrotermitis]SHE81964.1 hypothetical protein SAMN05444362_102253 [Dysgonomonas macrotermitis]